MQLAVVVSSGGCEGVRVHGGARLGRLPGAARHRPQPPCGAHVPRQRRPPRAGARTCRLVVHQPTHVQVHLMQMRAHGCLLCLRSPMCKHILCGCAHMAVCHASIVPCACMPCACHKHAPVLVAGRCADMRTWQLSTEYGVINWHVHWQKTWA